MTEHPLIFSSPMIRALLDGRKTQTRRLVTSGMRWHSLSELESASPEQLLNLTRWRVGDHIWVRETCRAEELPDGNDGVRYLADNEWRRIENTSQAADRWVKLHAYRGKRGADVNPIHMPRWASRLTLTVTGVRVEQLQDIGEADAIAEGVESGIIKCVDGDRSLYFGVPHCGQETASGAYADLWDSLHNPSGLCADDEPTGWDANPFVCAISFTTAHRNIDEPLQPEETHRNDCA